MSRSERRIASVLREDIRNDNDTPVQSQPRRDAGSRNEGGSERTSEGYRPVRKRRGVST